MFILLNVGSVQWSIDNMISSGCWYYSMGPVLSVEIHLNRCHLERSVHYAMLSLQFDFEPYFQFGTSYEHENLHQNYSKDDYHL